MNERKSEYLEEYKSAVQVHLAGKLDLTPKDLSSLDPQQTASRIFRERVDKRSADRLMWAHRILYIFLVLVLIAPLASTAWALACVDKFPPVTLLIILSVQLIMFITVVCGIVAFNRDN